MIPTEELADLAVKIWREGSNISIETAVKIAFQRKGVTLPTKSRLKEVHSAVSGRGVAAKRRMRVYATRA